MNKYLNKIIIVTRKDNTVREVMIMKDESCDKYCFVNLTTFHVCKCRFETVEDGTKLQEYREIKDYWTKRFSSKNFDYITFVYGYTKRNMTFKCNGIHIGKGKQECGAEPDKDYYVIEIGDKL